MSSSVVAVLMAVMLVSGCPGAWASMSQSTLSLVQERIDTADERIALTQEHMRSLARAGELAEVSPKHYGRSDVPAARTFVLAGSPALQRSRPGVHFYKSQSLDAQDHQRAVVPWGSLIHGVPMNDDWVKVGNRYLPRLALKEADKVLGDLASMSLDHDTNKAAALWEHASRPGHAQAAALFETRSATTSQDHPDLGTVLDSMRLAASAGAHAGRHAASVDAQGFAHDENLVTGTKLAASLARSESP